MFPTSSLRLLVLLACLIPCFARAEYVIYKSVAGVLIISNNPGKYFSFDVPGSTITPADLDRSPHPRLFSDAFYLEIIPITLNEPLPSSASEDSDLLLKNFEAAKIARAGSPTEISSQTVELRNDLPALLWSFIPYGEQRMFYCLAFRSDDLLFLLKSGFAEDQAEGDPGKFLIDIANSFVRSPTKIPPPEK